MNDGLRKSKSADESRVRQEQRELARSQAERERRQRELAEQARRFQRMVKKSLP